MWRLGPPLTTARAPPSAVAPSRSWGCSSQASPSMWRELSAGGADCLCELGEQSLHAASDVVANSPDAVEIGVGGVVDIPVLVAFAGVDRAGVAAHRDHGVGGLHDLVGHRLGELLADIQAELGHRRHHSGVYL